MIFLKKLHIIKYHSSVLKLFLDVLLSKALYQFVLPIIFAVSHLQ